MALFNNTQHYSKQLQIKPWVCVKIEKLIRLLVMTNITIISIIVVLINFLFINLYPNEQKLYTCHISSVVEQELEKGFWSKQKHINS